MLRQTYKQEEKAKLDKRGLSRIEAAKAKGREAAKESREKKSAKEETKTVKSEEKSENKPEA